MEERMILVKVAHGFSRFYVKTWKENNIYLIHQFVIGNVELRLIEKRIFSRFENERKNMHSTVCITKGFEVGT